MGGPPPLGNFSHIIPFFSRSAFLTVYRQFILNTHIVELGVLSNGSAKGPVDVQNVTHRTAALFGTGDVLLLGKTEEF